MIMCLIATVCFAAGLAAGYVLREAAAWRGVKRAWRNASLPRCARARGGLRI